MRGPTATVGKEVERMTFKSLVRIYILSNKEPRHVEDETRRALHAGPAEQPPAPRCHGDGAPARPCSVARTAASADAFAAICWQQRRRSRGSPPIPSYSNTRWRRSHSKTSSARSSSGARAGSHKTSTLSFDLARALRRIKPQRTAEAIRRRSLEDLPVVESPVAAGAELLLDTCVYVDFAPESS
jgi:hypothetical protein